MEGKSRRSVRRGVRVGMLLGLVVCGGCGLFWDDPYVLVTTTPLNWVEVHYYNARREPVRRESVRVTGAGFVEVKSGTSRRVSDSFAKSMTDATWDDYHTQQFQVDPEQVREMFQDLVNAGLFDRDKMFHKTKQPSPGRFIAVRAALDNKTYSETVNVFEEDPELAERLFNLVRVFKRPTLGRKKTIYATRPERKADAEEDDKQGDKDDRKAGEDGKEAK